MMSSRSVKGKVRHVCSSKPLRYSVNGEGVDTENNEAARTLASLCFGNKSTSDDRKAGNGAKWETVTKFKKASEAAGFMVVCHLLM